MVHERYLLLKANTAVGREGEALTPKTKDPQFLVSVLRTGMVFIPDFPENRSGRTQKDGPSGNACVILWVAGSNTDKARAIVLFLRPPG